MGLGDDWISVFFFVCSSLNAGRNHLPEVLASWVSGRSADLRRLEHKHMGLSENNVPLHPMVNDHYPY